MAASTPFKVELIRIAQGEHESLGSLRRGDLELEDRILMYCHEVGIAPTALVRAHYSAAFISWCMRAAGASNDEFPAAAGHWQYAQRALRDAELGQGRFRARRIESYAPQLGDVVHMNRDNGEVDYNQLRDGLHP